MDKSKIFLGIGALFSLIGFLGMCIYGAYTSTRGPTWLINQYLGLWLNVFLFFNSLQTIYILLAPHPSYTKKWSQGIQYGYFVIEALLFLIITVCHGIYGRGDLSVWAVVDLVVCGLNVYVIKLMAAESDPDKKRSCLSKTLSVVNWILKFFMIVICCLLTNGALVGGNAYHPRGSIHKVALEDGSGRFYNIHIFCEGPKNSTFPVVLFEGSGSHGYADYLGLQQVFTSKNIRSCSWDKAGLGFSDWMHADQHNHSNYYHNLIQAVGEQGPYMFVGWGGGGMPVYEYAVKHPQMVQSIIYLDAYPPQVEWTSQQELKGWTPAQYDAEVAKDINSREGFADIINGLGIPWGLVSIFVPPDQSWPEELRAERRWFMLTEKTWITQRWAMEDLATEPNVFKQELAKNISVSAVMSIWNDAQVQKLTCDKRKLDEKACDYEKRLNAYMIKAKRGLANVNGGVTVECTADECDQGYLVFQKPQFTVDAILEIYSKVPRL